MMTGIFIVWTLCVLYVINEGSGASFGHKLGIPYKKNKFSLRFQPTCFSEEWCIVEYTNSYGFIWHRILDVGEADVFGTNKHYETCSRTWSIHRGLKSHITRDFATIEDCREYNKEVREEVKKLNIRLNEQKSKDTQKIKDFYNERNNI